MSSPIEPRSCGRVRTYALLSPVLLLSALASALPAQTATPAPGYAAGLTPLPAPALGWSGLDRLPGGDWIAFDGKSLVALDRSTGKVKQTFVTLSTAVYASDLALSPSGKHCWFGESSTGKLYRYDLVAQKLYTVATLGGNFSVAFSPKDGDAAAWWTADPSFSANCDVYRVDTATGAVDLIATTTGYAGPLVFDADGSLYVAPAPTTFGAKGKGRILRFLPSKLASAIGPGNLSEKDALLWAQGFDNAFDLEWDGDGTLYATDVTTGSPQLVEFGTGGKSWAKAVLTVTGRSPTSLRFVPAPTPFERYGSEGAALAMLVTDYGKGNEVAVLEPATPKLVASVTTVKPQSPIRFTLTGAPPSGFALWLLGTGAKQAASYPLGHGGLAFPEVWVDLLQPFVFLATTTDAKGGSILDLTVPDLKGLTWTTQALCGPIQALPGGAPASAWASSGAVAARIQP
ncbi:MAG: hypothetical protein R3F30_15755 [Planctomycetota bacterium]